VGRVRGIWPQARVGECDGDECIDFSAHVELGLETGYNFRKSFVLANAWQNKN
jgi:hypothetical protein